MTRRSQPQRFRMRSIVNGLGFGLAGLLFGYWIVSDARVT